jgi:type I restriction enzyme S subunit
LLSLTVNGVVVRDISSGKGKFPSDFSTYQKVDNGDLVFCLFDVDETPRTVGCAYDTGMITGAYTVFEVKPEIRDYVYFYYLAIDNKKSLKPLYTGLRKVVPTDSFLRSKIAIPPLGEINRIVHHINERTEAIDNSTKLIENEISLLMEYKNSLISDVVTGKVDVRNIVIEELEEEIIEDIELDEDSIDEESLEAEDGDE